MPIEEEVEARAPSRFFEPKVFKFTGHKKVRVQPVLTPDNYAEKILALINSAKEIAEKGMFGSFSGTVPHAELNTFFRDDLAKRQKP